ncbi:nitrite reductase large subunit NirB [Aneurinibacillus sp. Ricciae_BoGa-3]|uniref:nitrite reductase large subunit NirB n=1 Tax=Aneurinibacillus sp. Ricciae_BoGa-3 TaxID=3022697 RepID=UPI002341B89D|nr:nitrite reductase large subunit NirB [Aneurinibacillus sp. Ricciae_BoGa-3]WCK55264.1 nitrite reductase large subunit NirB [Aneurinibacillus sp. Ricciae_BoGa-3]
MKREKLVLVGNGMAGVRCIEQILNLNPDKYEITIFGKEPHPNYNRILLSYVLDGASKMEDIILNDYTWYQENNIELYTGEEVTVIDTAAKIIQTSAGRQASYDRLILATGSLPFVLPVPGADKEGVIAFRNIEDCEAMIKAAKQYKKGVVIGAGLLGLEAARGLLDLGMEVTVVHLMDAVMEKQLDLTASKLLQQELEGQGMKFLLEKNTAEILGDSRVSGLRFTDGTMEEGDLVVMAAGIKPNTGLAKDSGIDVRRGIVVNDRLETSAEGVYALGECSEHRGTLYGLVAPLFEQAQVLAKHLCGVETTPYEGSVVNTKLKVSGVDVFSVGQFMEDEDCRSIKAYDELAGTYKKIVIKENRIVGAVLFGDTADSIRFMKMMKDEVNVQEMNRISVLDSECASCGSDVAAVMALADEEIICGCNGVSKGTIIDAIRDKGAHTVAEIGACTGAGRSCGGCKPVIAQILEAVLGNEFANVPQKQSMCACTDLSRDEVVAQIKGKYLTTVREVMHVLDWKEKEGCSKCRPALNYYLGMLWPHGHADEPESRFVNERMHANIQKDGTYSIVPRMYGGVTTPDDLLKIAEVAKKYQVPLVKATGGQRIALLGVKKEDVPKIWEELHMSSGYAYGKTLRTVKTCVGKQFCRFGTQDSTQMGIDLERKFERISGPAKIKMGVSGCPRNCAESLIKDVGVVAIDGGWKVYVGGNGGIKLRSADFLCEVKTSEEVIEWVGASLQYYREYASYGERTAAWIERVGIECVKEALASAEARAELNSRMDEALSVLHDPWEEIIHNDHKRALFEKHSAATV